MMGLDERFTFLIIGGIIGYILGYFVRSLRDIKEKVDEVDQIVKHDRSEGGFIRRPTSQGIALFVVVVLAFFASIQSQMNNNEVESNQKQQKTVTVCTRAYLSKTIVALNERTTYSRDQGLANIELQRAQAEFITSALQDPPLEFNRVESGLRNYLTALTKYVDLVGKTAGKQATNAYPTDEEFLMCLNGEKEM